MECTNSECKYNKKGKCARPKIRNRKYKTYDILIEEQWLKLRKIQEKRKKQGLEPVKKCENLDCINNIDGGCYLPSEIMVTSILTDEQLDKICPDYPE